MSARVPTQRAVRALRGVAITALLQGIFAMPAHAAPGFLPNTQGWVSWDAPALEGSPAWCCFGDGDRRDGRNQDTQRCDLESRTNSFGSRNGERTETIRLYARLQNGEVERLRTYAPQCAVTAATPIRHLGEYPAADSAALLGKLLSQNAKLDDARDDTPSSPARELHRNALAALAAHRGTLALELLAAETGSVRSLAQRKEAVFWIGQTRGEAGLAILKPLLLSDPDASLREHTAFAVSQSRAPQAIPLLITQGESDASAKVRAQAWFWLAQTKSPEAERAITAAVQKDADRKVRHQAVFALSQLPGERGVLALRAIAENRALDREDRKQAVFWLGQSKSPEAMAYLEKTLMRVAP